MGGIMSGGRSRRGGRPAAESCPVARLTHAEVFQHGRRDTYVRDDYNGWGMIVHDGWEFPVVIDTQHLHFGGVRRWMLCPCCQSRRQALYVMGKDQVACRECAGLRYFSQHESRRTRLYLRANKIRERLGWPPGALNPDGRKPNRMHWRTFFRLRTELHALTNALVGNLGDWCEKAETLLDRQGRLSRN